MTKSLSFSLSSSALVEANLDDPALPSTPLAPFRKVYSNRRSTRFAFAGEVGDGHAEALALLQCLLDTPAFDTSCFGGEPEESYRFRAAVRRLGRSLARQGVDVRSCRGSHEL